MSANTVNSGRNFWPIGLVATLGVFVAGTVVLVVLSTRTSNDLVSPDYYERELRHQENIDGRVRAQALGSEVGVKHDAGQRRLTLALPANHAGRAEGEILLYRPAAAQEDRRIALATDVAGRQTLDTGSLSNGLWRVRVTWRVGKEEFEFEKKVVIQDGLPKTISAVSSPSQIRRRIA